MCVSTLITQYYIYICVFGRLVDFALAHRTAGGISGHPCFSLQASGSDLGDECVDQCQTPSWRCLYVLNNLQRLDPNCCM